MQIQSILNININKNNTFQKNKYISFQGLSDPKHYETTIDYLAAKIVSAPKAKYQLPEDKCSANKIKRSIDMLLKGIDLFKDYPKSYLSRIKWASHLPE